jgi:hypothetical protein
MPFKSGQSKLYMRWSQIVQRCFNKKHPKYDRYGGRGIDMDPRWKESFAAFKADIPKMPDGDGWSLGRIDNDKGYWKWNVRWETREQQMRNTKRTRIVKIGGRKVVLQQLAEESGLDHRLLRNRLESGLPPEVATTRPREGGSIYFTHNGETHSLSVWCRKMNVNYMTVYARMKKGVTDFDELFSQVDRRK